MLANGSENHICPLTMANHNVFSYIMFDVASEAIAQQINIPSGYLT